MAMTDGERNVGDDYQIRLTHQTTGPEATAQLNQFVIGVREQFPGFTTAHLENSQQPTYVTTGNFRAAYEYLKEQASMPPVYVELVHGDGSSSESESAVLKTPEDVEMKDLADAVYMLEEASTQKADEALDHLESKIGASQEGNPDDEESDSDQDFDLNGAASEFVSDHSDVETKEEITDESNESMSDLIVESDDDSYTSTSVEFDAETAFDEQLSEDELTPDEVSDELDSENGVSDDTEDEGAEDVDDAEDVEDEGAEDDDQTSRHRFGLNLEDVFDNIARNTPVSENEVRASVEIEESEDTADSPDWESLQDRSYEEIESDNKVRRALETIVPTHFDVDSALNTRLDLDVDQIHTRSRGTIQALKSQAESSLSSLFMMIESDAWNLNQDDIESARNEIIDRFDEGSMAHVMTYSNKLNDHEDMLLQTAQAIQSVRDEYQRGMDEFVEKSIPGLEKLYREKNPDHTDDVIEQIVRDAQPAIEESQLELNDARKVAIREISDKLNGTSDKGRAISSVLKYIAAREEAQMTFTANVNALIESDLEIERERAAREIEEQRRIEEAIEADRVAREQQAQEEAKRREAEIEERVRLEAESRLKAEAEAEEARRNAEENALRAGAYKDDETPTATVKTFVPEGASTSNEPQDVASLVEADTDEDAKDIEVSDGSVKFDIEEIDPEDDLPENNELDQEDVEESGNSDEEVDFEFEDEDDSEALEFDEDFDDDLDDDLDYSDEDYDEYEDDFEEEGLSKPVIAAATGAGVALLGGAVAFTGFVWPGFFKSDEAPVDPNPAVADAQRETDASGVYKLGDSIRVTAAGQIIELVITEFNEGGAIAQDDSGQKYQITQAQLDEYAQSRPEEFENRKSDGEVQNDPYMGVTEQGNVRTDVPAPAEPPAPEENPAPEASEHVE